MDEEKAKAIIQECFQDDVHVGESVFDGLEEEDAGHIVWRWNPIYENDRIDLSSEHRRRMNEVYTIEQLEAIVWWMKNKRKEVSSK